MITELPPSPRSLIGDFIFFKKYPVRRALQELGQSDPKLNMKMAESLLTISAERFTKKWNFDPIAMQPKKGNFIWTPLLPEISNSINVEDNSSINLCSRIPKPEAVNSLETVPEPIKSAFTKVSESYSYKLEADKFNDSTKEVGLGVGLHLEISRTRGPKKLYQKSAKRIVTRRPTPKTPASRTRQSKITEYGRQRKRLNSTSKSEEELEASSPRKKILLDSPSKA